MDTRRINYGNPFDTTGFDKISDMISSLKARMRSTPVGQGINSLENALQKMLGPMNEDQIALFNRLKADVGGLDIGGFNMLGPVKDLAGKPVKPAVAELIRRIQEIKKEVPNVKPSLVKATVPQQMFAKYQPELKEVLSGGTIKDEALSKVASQIDDRFNISHTQYPNDYGAMQQTLRRGPSQDVVLMNLNEVTPKTVGSGNIDEAKLGQINKYIREYKERITDPGYNPGTDLTDGFGPLSDLNELTRLHPEVKDKWSKFLNEIQIEDNRARRLWNEWDESTQDNYAQTFRDMFIPKANEIVNQIESTYVNPTQSGSILASPRFKEALADHRASGNDYDLELSLEEGPLSEIKDMLNVAPAYKEKFKKILNDWYQSDISMSTQPPNIRKIAAERHQNIAREEIDKLLNHIEANDIHPNLYNPDRYDPDINKWAALEERNNGVHAQIKGTDWTKEIIPNEVIGNMHYDLEEFDGLMDETIDSINALAESNPNIAQYLSDHNISLDAIGQDNAELLEPLEDMIRYAKSPALNKHGQHNVGWFRVDDFSHPDSLFTGEDVPFDFEHPAAQNPFYLIDEVQSDLDTYKQRYYVDRDKIKESNPEDILNWFKSNPDMTNYEGYKFNDERLNNYYNKHINSEPNKLLDSQLTSWLDPEEVAWKDLVNSYINNKFKVPTGVNLKQEFKPEYGEWENVMMSNIIDQAIKDKAQNIFLHSPESIKLKGDGAGSIDSVNQRYYDKLPKRFGFELTQDHPFETLTTSSGFNIDKAGPELSPEIYDEWKELGNPENFDFDRRTSLYNELLRRYSQQNKAPMWKLDLSNVLGSE